QKLVHDHPLVVPGGEAARAAEDLVVVFMLVPLDEAEGVVVELKECYLQAADQQVLIVAWVRNDGCGIRVPRDILEGAAALDLELDCPPTSFTFCDEKHGVRTV